MSERARDQSSERGRDSEVGGSIPDPVSAFAERQKSHREVDIGAMKQSLEARSIC